MCQDPLHELLIALPKVEHHMHLEGSLSPEQLFDAAKRNNISLPTEDPAFASSEALHERYTRFTSLDDFLHYYFIGMSVLQTSEDFEELAYNYLHRAHSEHVEHAEVFFDPQAHTSRDVELSIIVEGFTRGKERALSDFGITCELIPCLLRHLPPADCHEAYLSFRPYLESGKVKGLGLSSTELNNTPSLFTESYNDAYAKGFNLTAHAGEEADVSYMASAITDLHCTRIDHGVKLTEDPTLLTQFAANRTLITMCPLSNIRLRVFKDISELPIRQYLAAKVPFSINSDDPAYFGGYIQENFCAVQEAFKLNVEEWSQIVMDSILLSWCSEERKDEILKRLSDVLATFA